METSYRRILHQVFQERHSVNSSYSLRSFARDLNIAPSSLSEILNGKKGISQKRSTEFAKKLRLPEWQAQFFCDLVAQEHAKSPQSRLEAKLRLLDRKQENQLHIINQNALKALTSWLDLAILEITHLKTFEPSTKWIAKRLGVSETLIANSVERLTSTGLLEIDQKTKTWTDISPLFSSTDGVPSDAIRRFHKTVLQLALNKLENPDLESRTVKTVVFSLSNENKKTAQKILDEAVSKIVALSDERSQVRDDVFCFSTQLFSLTTHKGKTHE